MASNQKSGCQLNRGCSCQNPTVLRFRSGLALGFLVGTHQRRMAQTNLRFFFACLHRAMIPKLISAQKTTFLEESQQEQEQKQKHIVDFTFNDSYILKGDSGKGLMKSIERLEHDQVFDH